MGGFSLIMGNLYFELAPLATVLLNLSKLTVVLSEVGRGWK